MPGNPDPRLNLALTLEQAGQHDQAIETYQTALEVVPEHVPTLQALGSLYVRLGRKDAETKKLMETLAFRAESEQWRLWAREQLEKMR